MDFSVVKIDEVNISQIENDNLTKYLKSRAVLGDYETKFSLSKILEIWNLMGYSSLVDLKIRSFSFEGFKFYSESGGNLDFTTFDSIISYIQGKEGSNFTIEINNFPKSSTLMLTVKSKLQNEVNKKLQVFIDLSKPESLISII